MAVKIGIIGGTGLGDAELFMKQCEESVDTPYGKPSDVLIHGSIAGVDCVLLARHGRKHNIFPTNVNYRANVYALHAAGCTHLLVTTACGSLQENIHPGEMVFVDQFIDRTTRRPLTFYDNTPGGFRGVFHVEMAEPFCPSMRKMLCEAAEQLKYAYHPSGTVVTIEGPRFSTRAESNLFRQWGAHAVNMTSVPEAQLAAEIGMCYAAVALPTDYDCWKIHEKPVDVPACLAEFKKLTGKVKELFLAVIPKLGAHDWTERLGAVQGIAKQGLMPGSDSC